MDAGRIDIELSQLSQSMTELKQMLGRITPVRSVELWLPAKEAIKHDAIKGQAVSHSQQLTNSGVRSQLLRLGKEYRQAIGGKSGLEFEVYATADRIAYFGRLSECDRLKKFGIKKLTINYGVKDI